MKLAKAKSKAMEPRSKFELSENDIFTMAMMSSGKPRDRESHAGKALCVECSIYLFMEVIASAFGVCGIDSRESGHQ